MVPDRRKSQQVVIWSGDLTHMNFTIQEVWRVELELG